MATFNLNTADFVADGQTLNVYPRTALPTEATTPTGSVVATATTAAGKALFTGLADSTEYVAYHPGTGRFRRFSTSATAAPTGTGTATVPDWVAGDPIKNNELRRLPDGSLGRWAMADGNIGSTYDPANWTIMSGAPPTVSTSDPPVSLAAGSVWYKVNASNEILGVWVA